MKKTKYIPVILSLSIFFTGCEKTASKDSIGLPSEEYTHSSEENEQLKKDRINGIEERHRVPGHIDWRKMDQRVRQRKQSKYFKDPSKIRLVNYLKSTVSDSSAIQADQLIENMNSLIIDAPLAESALEAGVKGKWIEKGNSNLSGRIRALTYFPDNQAIYAGSDGGQLWKGTLSGNDWVNLNDQVRFDHYKTINVFEHNGGIRILVTDSKEIYYSDDEGATWDIATGNFFHGNNEIGVMLEDKNHFVLASGNGGSVIYHSPTMGTTYTNIWSSSTPIRGVNIFGDETEVGGTVSLIDGSNFYIWENGTFELRGTLDFSVDPNIEDNFERAYLTRVGDTIYASVKAGSTSYVFRSINGGANWNYRGRLNDFPYTKSSFAVSKADPNTVIMGTVNMWKSTDGGEEWDKIYDWNEYNTDMVNKLHADIQDIKFYNRDGNDFALIATDGGIYNSYDNMDNVLNMSLRTLNVGQYYSVYTHKENPNIIYAGSQDQGFQRTFDGGEGMAEFAQITTGDFDYVVSQDGGKSLWFVYPQSLKYFKEADNPAWDDVYSIHRNTIGFDSHPWIQPIVEHPLLENSVLMGGGLRNGGTYLYRVTAIPGDFEWERLPKDFSEGFTYANVTSMGYSPLNKNVWYAMTSIGNFYYSRNAGEDWELSDIDGPDSDFFYGTDVLADPHDESKVYVSGIGYTTPSPVYVSENYGEDFVPLNNGLPQTSVNKLVLSDDGNYLFAATDVGAYVMPTSGDEWFDLGGPEQIYKDVEYVSSLKIVRFATYGRGIWDFDMSNVPTESEYYHIVHKGTDRRLQTCNTEPGSLVQTKDASSKWHCAQWKVIRNGSSFHIQNRNSGLYARPAGDKNGAAIEQRPASWNGAWTQWRYLDTGDGYGHLINNGTGKFLFVNNEGVLQQQPNSWTGGWTRWEFVPVEE